MRAFVSVAIAGSVVLGAVPASAKVSIPLSPSRMTVSTIAGSGLPSTVDGPAMSAGLIQPSGLAYDAHGVLYVTDSAAQRIRKLSGGRLETIAGSGELNPSTHIAPIGYADGAARTAHFNFPVGIAIGPDGTIYIADSGNHVIRQIRDNRVSTFAGIATDASGKDGPPGTASFHDPLGISFGPDGRLYVADHGIGLRVIEKDRSIHTMLADTDTTGVSVVQSATSLTIWWCGLRELRRYTPLAKEDLRFPAQTSVGQGLQPLRSAYQLVALSAKDVIFSDLISNTVRYYRMGNDFEHTPLIRSLLGSDSADLPNTGGYRDGAVEQAGANAPMGVAVAPDGSIAFGDGSGRLRRIAGFTTRHFIDPDLDGLEPLSGHDLRFAFISNSYANWDVLWHESTGGVLEDRLNADAAAIGLNRHVHVDVLRTAGTNVASELEFATSVLLDSGYDGVILGINSYSDGALRTETTYQPMQAAQMTSAVKDAQAQFKAHGMFFDIVAHPVAVELVPFERITERVKDEYPAVDRSHLQEAVRVFTSTGVPTFDSTPAFLDYEAQPDRIPLFSETEWHFSIAGNYVLGNFLADELEKTQPWRRSAK